MQQLGFLTEQFFVNKVFVMRQMIAKSVEYNRLSLVCFIGSEKALIQGVWYLTQLESF